MALFQRPDGVPVADAPLVRRFMPFIIRRRNEALVWFEQDIEVDRALAFADAFARDSGRRLTFFHLALRAVARALHEFPKLNRYVVGRRLYQRSDVAISFSGKEAFEERAPLYVRKRSFPRDEPLAALAGALAESIRDGRSGARTDADREMAVLSRLPRPATDAAVWGARILDYFNLLPGRMILGDPLYASAFVANLGSVGIDGAYHHLYEYGTVPVFLVIGAYRMRPVAVADGTVQARRVSTFRYTYDERVEDGFYCARAVARVKQMLENPELLA